MDIGNSHPVFMKVTIRRYAKASDLPPIIKKAMSKIISYAYDFAAEDFTFADSDKKEGHAFQEIDRLMEWLETD